MFLTLLLHMFMSALVYAGLYIFLIASLLSLLDFYTIELMRWLSCRRFEHAVNVLILFYSL